jgi:hypothetical protein
MESSARKTTTRTHEGSKLLGVHIGVYKACPDLMRTIEVMSAYWPEHQSGNR